MVSGIGAGGVYATCVGNAVKWFPDRRGLAVGLTAAGFGAGAAVTVIPIQKMIASIGYADTFFWFALVQGGVVFVLAWLLRAPYPGEAPSDGAVKVLQSKTSSTPGQMLASPVFWLLYLMFVLVSASGLMVAAQIALIAKDYGVAQTVILFGGTTLIVAGVIDNLAMAARGRSSAGSPIRSGANTRWQSPSPQAASPIGCSDRPARHPGPSSSARR